MKSIFDLLEQKEFTKGDLRDILAFCRIEGDLSPLCAVAYIPSEQGITEEDTLSLSRLLNKYPALASKF